MQENEGIQVQKTLVELPTFNDVVLPEGAIRII